MTSPVPLTLAFTMLTLHDTGCRGGLTAAPRCAEPRRPSAARRKLP